MMPGTKLDEMHHMVLIGNLCPIRKLEHKYIGK